MTEASTEEKGKRRSRNYTIYAYRISPRDEEVLTALFFAPYQTMEQLRKKASLHRLDATEEETLKAIKQRLYRLAYKGMVESYPSENAPVIWKLTRDAWQREADNLYRFDGKFRKKFPKNERIPHFIDTNEFYDALARRLDNTLGSYPAWQWMDEQRAYREYRNQEGRKYHRPDAEVHFGEWIFFIERQTERSRKPQRTFDDRCKDYRSYIEQFGKDSTRTFLVFGCDTQRDMEYVRNAAKKHGVSRVVGTVGQTVNTIVEKAEEVRKEQEPTG